MTEHAETYANPEADLERAVEVSRLAVEAGHPHPMSSEFAWPLVIPASPKPGH